MVRNNPWRRGEGPVAQPPTRNSPPNYLGQPASGSRPWLAIGVAVTAAVANAALLLAHIRPPAPSTSASTPAPTHGPEEIAAAQQQLCDIYKVAAQAAQGDTAGTGKAPARIATTNGALRLEMAAVNPVVDRKHRDAAQALAMAYGTVTGKGSAGVATDAEYQAALEDAIATDAAMKKVCSGG